MQCLNVCIRRDVYLRVCLKHLNPMFHPVDALIKELSLLVIIVARSAIRIPKVASAVRKKAFIFL
jgi:hypothetical protein